VQILGRAAGHAEGEGDELSKNGGVGGEVFPVWGLGGGVNKKKPIFIGFFLGRFFPQHLVFLARGRFLFAQKRAFFCPKKKELKRLHAAGISLNTKLGGGPLEPWATSPRSPQTAGSARRRASFARPLHRLHQGSRKTAKNSHFE